MLSFRDFDAWLENSRGRHLRHSIPVIDRSTVNATVKVRPGTLYSFCWRYTTRSQPISALSEVFIVDATKQQRVVHVIMIDSKPATLSRCSAGILELPFDKNEHLRVPDILGGASVRLEIRRSKGRIRETRVQDPKNPSVQLYTTDADFVDEPETKAPWVTFEFNLRDPSTDSDALDMYQKSPNPLLTPVSSLSTQIQQNSEPEDLLADCSRNGVAVVPRQSSESSFVDRNSPSANHTPEPIPCPPAGIKRSAVQAASTPSKHPRRSSPPANILDIEAQFTVVDKENRRLKKTLRLKLEALKQENWRLHVLLDKVLSSSQATLPTVQHDSSVPIAEDSDIEAQLRVADEVNRGLRAAVYSTLEQLKKENDSLRKLCVEYNLSIASD